MTQTNSHSFLQKFLGMLRPNTKPSDNKPTDTENDGDSNNKGSISSAPRPRVTCLTSDELSRHNIRVLNHISDEYRFDLSHPVSDGASAKVYRAVRALDESVVAIKLIPCSNKLNKRLFLNEISVLRRVDHPNIIRLLDAVVDGEYFGLVLPFCCGGSLSDVIGRMGANPLDETSVVELVAMMLNAIAYLSSQNIAHRDLKPDNFVFADREQTQLVLIDLADAVRVDPAQTYSDFTGTLLYISPETFRPRHGRELLASDVWSIGVITYELVTGTTPFNAPNGSMKKVMTNILMNRYDMPTHISRHCHNFIQALLTVKICDRVSAESALTLPFLTEEHRWCTGAWLPMIASPSPSWRGEEEEK